MAKFTITYTPNYLGCHRICLTNNGDTDCYIYTDSSASVIGTPKTVEITVTEEILEALRIGSPFFCGDVTIDGYVQACCAAEDDEESKERFGFVADVSTPCMQYALGCSRAGIALISVVNGGSGYNPGMPPAVTITSLSGAGATATATIAPGGHVDSIVITNAGDGYNNANNPVIVTIDPPPGPGTQATAAFVQHTPCGEDGIVSYIDCDNEPTTILASQPGQLKYICTQTVPDISDAGIYATSQKQAGTPCCECKTLRITNLDKDPITVTYFNCDGRAGTEVISPSPAGPGYIDRCCINNTPYTTSPPSYMSVAILGDCSE